jgi:protein SCO1/2
MKAVLLLTIALVFGMMTVSCNKKSSINTSNPATKHYRFKGKVISIDARGKMANIDNEAIPGFMDAMTMPYKIRPESELNNLRSGDVISADLLVQDEGAWLENVVVLNHSPITSK